MDRALLGIVGGAMMLALVTAPLLPGLPGVPEDSVRVDDVQAANTLIAVKAGCYLVRTDVPQEESVLFQEQLLNNFGAVVTGAGGVRYSVIRTVSGRDPVTLTFPDGDRTRVGMAVGVSVAQAADVPLYIDAEVLKQRGTNMCTEP